MKKRVVIGLSGGVDSSVAAWILKEQGYDVTGLFMKNWFDTTGLLQSDCHWEDDLMFAEMVAKKLDIPFHMVDLSGPYRQRVVDYMFSEYEKGRTPNPDVLCNREIKFDSFADEARKIGGDFVATGHYCRKETIIIKNILINRLLAGKDSNKDQSYFLCQLSQEQLSTALFPVGDLIKPEVRKIADRLGLATAQRNHIGLAVRAFLRFEVASLKTGLSWFEAKIRIIRDAIRAYLANPVYALQATA